MKEITEKRREPPNRRSGPTCWPVFEVEDRMLVGHSLGATLRSPMSGHGEAECNEEYAAEYLSEEQGY